jgi:hypothetical protein
LRRSILPSPNNPLAHSRKLDGSGVELGTTESDRSVELYVRFHTSPVGSHGSKLGAPQLQPAAIAGSCVELPGLISAACRWSLRPRADA